MNILGWLAAVVAATAIGLTAVSLLTDGLTNRSTISLSHNAVANALASSQEAPEDDTVTRNVESPSETTAERAVSQSVSSLGGTIIVRCTATTAYLEAWTPEQGFSVDKYERGPAESVLVQFDGDDEIADDQEITMTATCRMGEPVAAVIILDD